MAERAVAWVYVAVRPVTLVQEEGTVVEVPLMKFTAAHWEDYQYGGIGSGVRDVTW